jgi:hypothetical protein
MFRPSGGRPSPSSLRRPQLRWCWGGSCCISGKVLEGGSVDVGDSILLLAGRPGDAFPHFELSVIPHLYLVLGGIAADQQFSLPEVDGVARDVGAEDCPHAPPLPQVPLVDHAVPSARHYRVVVDELHCEDTVRVTAVVPLGAAQVNGHALGI